jgi:hypothetical protein
VHGELLPLHGRPRESLAGSASAVVSQIAVVGL